RRRRRWWWWWWRRRWRSPSPVSPAGASGSAAAASVPEVSPKLLLLLRAQLADQSLRGGALRVQATDRGLLCRQSRVQRRGSAAQLIERRLNLGLKVTELHAAHGEPALGRREGGDEVGLPAARGV